MNNHEVNITVKQCWCGNCNFKPYRKGLFLDRQAFELQSCVNCGTVITRFASDKHISYDGSYLYETLSHRHYESIKTIEANLKQGSLIDIGCNIGLLVREIKNRNPQLEVKGIEIDEKAVSFAIGRGVSVERKYINELKGTYDNIILMHVIEHIPDLGAFFTELRRISRRGTMIYIAVPNIVSFNAVKNLEKWGALNPDEHIWHFSKKTLAKMVEHNIPGANIVEVKTSWIWPHRLGLINWIFPGDQLEIVLSV